MKLDNNGEDFIKNEEGFSLKAYKDSGGVWTILWGFTYSPITGKPITKDTVLTLADAEVFWEKGIKPFEELVTNNLKDCKLSQNNFNALVSLCWNIGKGGFSNSTLVLRLKMFSAYLKASNIPTFLMRDSISYWFLVWHMDNGEVNSSLLARRKREITLYFT